MAQTECVNGQAQYYARLRIVNIAKSLDCIGPALPDGCVTRLQKDVASAFVGANPRKVSAIKTALAKRNFASVSKQIVKLDGEFPLSSRRA